jgi:hypothetical protein
MRITKKDVEAMTIQLTLVGPANYIGTLTVPKLNETYTYEGEFEIEVDQSQGSIYMSSTVETLYNKNGDCFYDELNEAKNSSAYELYQDRLCAAQDELLLANKNLFKHLL